MLACRVRGAIFPLSAFQCCVTFSLMRPNRTLQLEILRALRNDYPGRTNIHDLPRNNQLLANLHYLHEHGLVDVVHDETMGNHHAILAPKITAKGLDFLEDDGGVTAILSTVIVKLNPDDLRALLAGRVESSNLPDKEKSALARTIRSLTTTGLQSLTNRLVNDAVANGPGVLQILQNFQQ